MEPRRAGDLHDVQLDPVGCNLMVAHASSTAPLVRPLMAIEGNSNATFAFPWSRFERDTANRRAQRFAMEPYRPHPRVFTDVEKNRPRPLFRPAWRAQQSSRRQAQTNSDQAIGKHGQALQASFAQHEVSRKPNQEIIMKATLIDRQPATVACFRYIGPYGEAIARFWRETYVQWAVMNKPGADHAR